MKEPLLVPEPVFLQGEYPHIPNSYGAMVHQVEAELDVIPSSRPCTAILLILKYIPDDSVRGLIHRAVGKVSTNYSIKTRIACGLNKLLYPYSHISAISGDLISSSRAKPHIAVWPNVGKKTLLLQVRIHAYRSRP